MLSRIAFSSSICPSLPILEDDVVMDQPEILIPIGWSSSSTIMEALLDSKWIGFAICLRDRPLQVTMIGFLSFCLSVCLSVFDTNVVYIYNKLLYNGGDRWIDRY